MGRHSQKLISRWLRLSPLLTTSLCCRCLIWHSAGGAHGRWDIHSSPPVISITYCPSLSLTVFQTLYFAFNVTFSNLLSFGWSRMPSPPSYDPTPSAQKRESLQAGGKASNSGTYPQNPEMMKLSPISEDCNHSLSPPCQEYSVASCFLWNQISDGESGN